MNPYIAWKEAFFTALLRLMGEARNRAQEAELVGQFVPRARLNKLPLGKVNCVFRRWQSGLNYPLGTG